MFEKECSTCACVCTRTQCGMNRCCVSDAPKKPKVFERFQKRVMPVCVKIFRESLRLEGVLCDQRNDYDETSSTCRRCENINSCKSWAIVREYYGEKP